MFMIWTGNVRRGFRGDAGMAGYCFHCRIFWMDWTEELENYNELMKLFPDAERFLSKAPGEKGLWHQVLTDSSSYEEASCTAMFTMLFPKALRMGGMGKRRSFTEKRRRKDLRD